jgi:hypothetical protein
LRDNRHDEEGAMAKFSRDIMGIGALLGLIAGGLIVMGL